MLLLSAVAFAAAVGVALSVAAERFDECCDYSDIDVDGSEAWEAEDIVAAVAVSEAVPPAMGAGLCVVRLRAVAAGRPHCDAIRTGSGDL